MPRRGAADLGQWRGRFYGGGGWKGARWEVGEVWKDWEVRKDLEVGKFGMLRKVPRRLWFYVGRMGFEG